MPRRNLIRKKGPATMLRLAALLGVLAWLIPAVACHGWDEPAEPTFTPDQVVAFEKMVEPLLKKHCWSCHGGPGGKVRGGLKLTARSELVNGGDSGPALDTQHPEASLFLKAIRYHDDDLKMPPKGKLPAEDLAVLERWIKEGAPWRPTAAKTAAPPAKPHSRGGVVDDAAQRYWAYQPVHRPPVPEVKHGAWVRQPADAFILAKLEALGLEPAPPADRVALIRRVYYDLIGLPPTPEEVDAFVNDAAPDAYDRLVDRLLASPHYGEKWGRHWLDLVRFAETNGYERDGPKPFAWRFRDYVIRSFNADKPYDQFIKEQLAGDELPGENADAIVATGFHRLGLWDDEPADPEQALFDGYDDLIATTGQVFLGMTLNCARCHEHKADPIPHADYYRFLAFFRDVRPFSNNREVKSSFNLTDITPPEQRRTYEEERKKRLARIEELVRDMTTLEDATIKTMPAEDQRASEGLDRPLVVEKAIKLMDAPTRRTYLALRREVNDLKNRPDPAQALALSVNNCWVKPPPTHVLIRGNAGAKGKEVQPGFPMVLGGAEPTIPVPSEGAKSSGRRSKLAEWIASPTNPLTARVWVNRLWQHHFGRGIVPTPNDFGKLGEPPSHPELLDWLAAEFIAGGWTHKRMHKLLLTSNTYLMSSQAHPSGLVRDPGNVHLWRFRARRLTAEEVRDSMLAVSGQLNREMFGPSVYPRIPREVLAGQSKPGEGWGKATPEQAARRSVYVYQKRSLLVPILSHHDQADTDSSCPVRYTTTVPTQALGMLNGEFTTEQAAALAQRLRAEAPGEVKAQVVRALRLATGRVPSAEEVAKDVAFIAAQQQRHGVDETEALRRFCLLVLNLNEFVYLD